MFIDREKDKIVPTDNMCEEKHLTKDKEYEILEIEDNMPSTPDEYYKIENDIGEDVWIDDWDCKAIK